MNKKVVKKWIAALRSGKYKQTTGQLKTDDDRYCCLGVLCDLAVKDGVIESFRGRPGYLPPSVRKWVGLRKRSGEYTRPRDDDYSSLAQDNDSGHSFEWIAGLIERAPKGLFVKSPHE